MFSTLYFVIISATLVYGNTSYVSIPPEQLPQLLKISMDCVSKTGVDLDTLQKLISWSFEDTEQVRHYIYCFGSSSGLVDKSGHLVKNNIVKLVGDHKKKAEFSDVLDECNKSAVGVDKYDTLYKATICFHEKSPILFKL